MTHPKVIPLPRARPAAAAPLAERSDDELMVLSQAGAREAFAVLAGRYMARIVAFCTKLLGDARLGEETAQETWLGLWSERHRYVPRGKFAVLLYTAAKNRCRNHARDARRRGRWVEAAEPAALERVGAAPEQLEELLARERTRRVHRALADLPLKLREAVVLRFSEGLDYEDIAAVVGAGESTVRSRVHHGLKGLRAQVEEGKKP